MRHVLLLGRKGSGKTTTLKTMLVSSREFQGEERRRKSTGAATDDESKELGELFLTAPTLGVNSEKVTFNVWQVFDVFDAGGSTVQRREVWRAIYRSVAVDTVVYALDVSQFISSDSDPGCLETDRVEIHKLLSEAELRRCDFYVFLIFKSVQVDDKIHVGVAVKEALELDKFISPDLAKRTRRIDTVVEYGELASNLNIDKNFSTGLFG